MNAENLAGFVDANVLVYAHDGSAGDKRTRARELVQELWNSGEGCLSVQVLQELFVALTRHVPRPLDVDGAAVTVSDFSAWRTHAPTASDVMAAIDGMTSTSENFEPSSASGRCGRSEVLRT
jgi:predicted nucleic acid-binding protein